MSRDDVAGYLVIEAEKPVNLRRYPAMTNEANSRAEPEFLAPLMRGSTVFSSVMATAAEVATPRAGDGVIPAADVVMDRAFTVPGRPTEVWPWIAQMGKRRAGWYLPRRVERLLPRSRRASRVIDPQWLGLQAGDVIPDYGLAEAIFEVVDIDAPHFVVYRSVRGKVELTWSITVQRAATPGQSRVFLRLRLAPVRRKWLAKTAGELLDKTSVAGLAAGLAERLEPKAR